MERVNALSIAEDHISHAFKKLLLRFCRQTSALRPTVLLWLPKCMFIQETGIRSLYDTAQRNAETHSCLELDSNPRSKCLNGITV